jgi:hypothetical protein
LQNDVSALTIRAALAEYDATNLAEQLAMVRTRLGIVRYSLTASLAQAMRIPSDAMPQGLYFINAAGKTSKIINK